MAKAYKCDRCGCLYEQSDENNYSGIHLVKCDLYNEDPSYATIMDAFDLCPSCMVQIVGWLKMSNLLINSRKNPSL